MPENENDLRDRLFHLITQIHSLVPGCKNHDELKELRGINRSCLQILRKLQNENICSRKADSLRAVRGDVLQYVDRLLCAANLLLFGEGKKIEYRRSAYIPSGGFEPILVECIVMNLISNACKFSGEGAIRFEVTPTRSGFSIEISHRRAENCIQGNGSRGRGLLAIQNAARIHGGTTLIYPGEDFIVTAASIRLDRRRELDKFKTPDLTTLFTDRLSPVYIGLCDVCSCPI